MKIDKIMINRCIAKLNYIKVGKKLIYHSTETGWNHVSDYKKLSLEELSNNIIIQFEQDLKKILEAHDLGIGDELLVGDMKGLLGIDNQLGTFLDVKDPDGIPYYFDLIDALKQKDGIEKIITRKKPKSGFLIRNQSKMAVEKLTGINKEIINIYDGYVYFKDTDNTKDACICIKNFCREYVDLKGNDFYGITTHTYDKIVWKFR